LGPQGASSTTARPAGSLTPTEAAQVLAKVGDHTITLGEFNAALERMDRFERLRYQSLERRKQLLDEMIDLELMATEAQRRGLDRQPEVQLRLDEALREEQLSALREGLPSPDSLPEAQVRTFYQAHLADYADPERRRVSAIVVTSEKLALSLIERAAQASPTRWGELVREHSVERSPLGDELPLELAGDLGIASPPGQPRGTGPELPEPVLRALFEIPEVGKTAEKPVQVGGRYYVLRLTGRTEARRRTFAEAERSIRVRLVQERIAEAERQLLETARQRFPVTMDSAAIGRLRPAPLAKEPLRDALRP